MVRYYTLCDSHLQKCNIVNAINKENNFRAYLINPHSLFRKFFNPLCMPGIQYLNYLQTSFDGLLEPPIIIFTIAMAIFEIIISLNYSILKLICTFKYEDANL
jgi:hypothetical protein